MKRARRVFEVAAVLTFYLWTTTAALSFAGATARVRKDPPPDGDRSAVSRDQLERLRRVMLPLVKATNHPRRFEQMRVKILEDARINAASAGGGEFYVTSGLLNRANDDQLRGVLAHEIAHDDLGHPAKAQVLGTGLGLGVMLLDQLIPGSRAVAPIAGTLIAGTYSRPQEYEADRHAVQILRRAGYPKDVMTDTLAWLLHAQGNSGGGILSTHPATSDRVQALKRLR
jgi:Zn-dependent protease with chaperone function